MGARGGRSTRVGLSEGAECRPGSIAGVQTIELVTHVDDRGTLTEIARHVGSDSPHAVVEKFGQIYIVRSPTRGTIRAFHKHEVLWDYFHIGHGSAKFVAVDDRPGSATYRCIETQVLSSSNPALLVVPPGVYHGWMALEDRTQLISLASEVYRREQPDEVRIPPDTFGDVWTVHGR